MAASPYLNQVQSTTPEKFSAKDEAAGELRIEKTGRGWTVTVEPQIDYPATFHMNFETKAALIDWLSQADA